MGYKTQGKHHFDAIYIGLFYFLFGVIGQEVAISEVTNYLASWYNEPFPHTINYNFSPKALGLTLPVKEEAIAAGKKDFTFGDYLLPHQFMDDLNDRDMPLLTASWSNRTLGLFLPNAYIWTEIGFLMFIQLFFAYLSAKLIFRFVIMRPKPCDRFIKTFVGLCCVIPFWFVFPAICVTYLGIDNRIVRFTLIAVTPSMSIFRTTEALAGQTPKELTISEGDFIVYFVSPMTPVYDKELKQYKKYTRSFLKKKIRSVINNWIVISWFYSMCSVAPRVFVQIGPPYDLEKWYSYKWFFLTNSTWTSGWWTGLFLFTMVFTGEAGCLVTALITGYEIEPYFDNPMYRAQSITEWWSERWNLMIQRVLKRGIYIPFCILTTKFKKDKIESSSSSSSSSSSQNEVVEKKGGKKHRGTKLTKTLALLLTFITSGLYHEWLAYMILSVPTTKGGSNYPVFWGGAYLYFMWQGSCCLVEMTFFPKSWMKGDMPKWFKPLWAYVIAFPGPWFLGTYAHTNFFRDGFTGYPIVQPCAPLNNSTSIF